MFEITAAVLEPNSGFRLSTGQVLPTTSVFDMYWYFAAERQEIFYRRLEGRPGPWTDDPILRAYRFTNVYRAADRVSQFLIRKVLYEGDQSVDEIFFRALLFKLFNKIETWELLQTKLGPLNWASFDVRRYISVLDAAMKEGRTIYSPAYIIPSPNFGSPRKHVNHLHLLRQMMDDGAPQRIARAKSLEEVFLVLRSFPSIGNFLAFQFAIDLNYSEILQFSEMEFVVAGPGAKSGIRKAFKHLGDLTDEQIIREVAEAADREFGRRGLRFRNLWGRAPQLIDCQNLFCEIDKYSRVALPGHGDGVRTRIKRKYQPLANYDRQWYPPKWRLDIPVQYNVE